MTNTGAFQILRFEMVRIPHIDEEVVDSITARCQRCGHVTTVNDGAVHHLSGGLVMQCAQCRNRQALSNAGLLPSHGQTTRLPS
ncbi:MAG: hypothetical protein JHC82_01490 [Stenotrophomonas sp.]|jgi:hypothetical protein|nr:hypothetical protein [Stenotrophomonas sp.]